MRKFLTTFLLSFFFAFSLSLAAEENEDLPVRATIITEHEWIQPGEPFSLALHFDIEKNWHTYWKNPGDAGMPVSIDWHLPHGFIVKEMHWQAPTHFELDTTTAFGYENEMIFLAELEAPALLDAAEIVIEATANWLACSDTTCLPGNSGLKTALAVKKETPAPKDSAYFNKVRQNLPKNDWDLAAVSNSETIKLKVKTPKEHNKSYTTSRFFPEENGSVSHLALIDHKNEGDDTHYEVTLKYLEKEGKSQHLKGVLVLSEKGGSQEFLSIDMPLKKENGHELIASLDKSEIKSHGKITASESELEGNFLMALVFAFVGGMILNLMPCVLPVLSLKIFSFVKMSGESRSLCLKHGLSFSLGVLISFWVLAGSLLLLQAYGKAVGWGFQLQEPIFVAILASIIFILGLNLFGVMEMGTGITSLAGNIKTKKEGLFSSFCSGILATAIATPCTGPFLGSAVGYAVTLPPVFALLIFTVLGTGMAFPYLLLSAYPNLLRFIPKPGNWMIIFKEIMGFIMMATTLWLLWIFGAQTGALSQMLLVGALLLFAIGAWIYGKWACPLKNKRTRRISYIFSLGFLAAGIFAIITASHFPTEHFSENQEIAALDKKDINHQWETFSPERVKELQAQGIPVFIDFTAKWCLICQVNHLSLTAEHAESKFNQAGVVRMKADWTKNDPVITKELRKFGRNSVPLYVLYGKDEKEEPKVLPQVLTSDIVAEYIDQLK
ncbi:MAG TPA: protein-disulfide reductase DsbD family protein [Parachlamydiaceae bacterium]|nr:protein-disulfide reductase DsbD family protein [Parachlamydiaceae bacterium]